MPTESERGELLAPPSRKRLLRVLGFVGLGAGAVTLPLPLPLGVPLLTLGAYLLGRGHAATQQSDEPEKESGATE